MPKKSNQLVLTIYNFCTTLESSGKNDNLRQTWVYFTHVYVGGKVAVCRMPTGHIDTEEKTEQVNQRNLQKNVSI